MAESQNSKQNVQAPQAGQTVIVNAIPGQDIVLEAAFDQAEVKMDGGNVVFEFANGGQVVLDFTDLGDAQAPNVVMPDGTVLDMQEFLASLGEKDVEPAAGPDGGATGSGGVGEYQDDAGDVLGGTDKLGGLEDDPFPAFTLASIDAIDDNPLPSAGIVSGASDEDGLVREWGVTPYDGNDDEAGGDNPATASFVKGFLNYDFGGDGPADVQPFAWNLAGLPSVTSQGHQVLYEVSADGQTLNGYWEFTYQKPISSDNIEMRLGVGESGVDFETVVQKVTVFSLELTNLETGEYLFTLYRPLDHSEFNTEDDIAYNFTFTVTDGSGDPATGGLNLIIDDDSPVARDVPPIERTVDEDDILLPWSSIGTSPNDGAGGDESYTGNPFLKYDFGAANIWGSVKSLVSFGADGRGENGFSLIDLDTDPHGLDALRAQNLTSKGEDLDYRIVGSMLIAFVPGENQNQARMAMVEDSDGQPSMPEGRPVFVLELQSNGSYKFSLIDQLDHYDENDQPVDSLPIDLSSVIVATDGDGDSITLESGFVINITDDAPKVVGRPIKEWVAENDIDTKWSTGTSPNDGDRWDGSFTGDPSNDEAGPAFVAGNLGHIVNFGADETGRFMFTKDAISQLEALNLKSMQSSSKGELREVGLEYSISKHVDKDGYYTLTATEPDIEGRWLDTSNPVFELRLNSLTGQYEFRLYDELVHKGDEGKVIEIDFGSVIQAVDADGDAVVLENAFIVKIVDDKPIAVDDEHVINEDTQGLFGWIGGNVTDNDINGADESLSFDGWESTQAQHGWFIGWPDGSYSYNLYNDKVQYLDDGDEPLTETFKYSIRDTDGDISTATLTIVIEGRNDQPTLTVKTGNWWNSPDTVYESALDSGSNPSSDGEFAYGTFKIADPDGLDDIQSLTINGNTFGIGELVGKEVEGDSGTLTITFYNDQTGEGEYKYELTKATENKPGDEFDKFTLTTSDGTESSNEAVIKILINDDAPKAYDNYASLVEGGTSAEQANLVVVLDTSGSMFQRANGGVITVDGVETTRLALASDAVAKLIAAYGSNLNQLMFVTFDTDARIWNAVDNGSGGWNFVPANVNVSSLDSNGAGSLTEGSYWMSASVAANAVTSIAAVAATRGGTFYTDYDDALAAVVGGLDGTSSPNGLPTYLYFLSDGNPYNSNGPGNGNVAIDVAERGHWTSFLQQSDLNIQEAYAVGIGSGVNEANLRTVAWSATPPHADNVVLVTEETDLAAKLIEIADMLTGNVITDADISGTDLPGADDWGTHKLAWVEHDTNGDGIFDGSSNEKFVFNDATLSHTIDTKAGTVVIESDGTYTFTALKDVDLADDVSDKIKYTIQDSDGSKSSAFLHLTTTDSSEVTAYDNYKQAVVREVEVPGTKTTTTKVLADFEVGDSSPGTPDMYNPWVFDESGNPLGQESSVRTTSDVWAVAPDLWGRSSNSDVVRSSNGSSDDYLIVKNAGGGADATMAATPAFTVGENQSVTIDFDVQLGVTKNRGYFSTDYSDTSNNDVFSYRVYRFAADSNQWEIASRDGNPIGGELKGQSNRGINNDVAINNLGPGTYRLVFSVDDGSGGNNKFTVRIDDIRTITTTTVPPSSYIVAENASGNVLTDEMNYLLSSDPWDAVDNNGSEGASLLISNDGVNFVSVDPAGTTVAGSYGSLFIASDGGYTYTPASSLDNVGHQDVFTYKLVQPDGDFDTANLVIGIESSPYVEPTPITDPKGGELVGTNGDDVILGSSDDDVLKGNDGDDHLEGRDGNDTLEGGLGDDIIIGGAGDDHMTGGAGSDTFAYNAGDLDDVLNGDIITDFQLGDGGDTLDLSGLLNGAPGGLDKFLDFEVSNIDAVAGTATVAVQVSQNGNDNFTSLATIEVSGAAGLDDHDIESMLIKQIDI